MKILKSLLIIFVLLIFNSAFGAHQLYADKDGINIPYGTKFTLSMGQNLTTRNILEGDIFQAYLKEDIYVNNVLTLPQGTLFRGRVSKIKYSKWLSRPASLYLTLDHLVTKYGVQLPLDAGLTSGFEYILMPDGALTTNGNYFKAVSKDAKRAGQIVVDCIDWGKDTGENAQYVFVPIGALGGSIGCVGYTFYSIIADLIKRGDEVVLKKGDEFDIELLNTLNIPN